MRTVLAALFTVALAVGCAGVDQETEPETQPGATAPATEPDDRSPTPDTTAGTEAAEELEPDEDVDEAGQRVIEFDSPFTHEGSATRLAVTGIGFTSRDWDGWAEDEVDLVFGDDGQTAVVLGVGAENTSDQVIAFYPDQGEIVLGSEQVAAETFISDSVGHSEWQPGVARDGSVVFISNAPFEDVEAIGELRYLVGAASDAETFSPVGEDVDLTITWTP